MKDFDGYRGRWNRRKGILKDDRTEGTTWDFTGPSRA
jgi:hypothetical protein